MELLNVFAIIGMVINDPLALLSVLGSLTLLIGVFSKARLSRYGKIADWSILRLVFGGVFQFSLAVTSTMPEKIGVIFRMPALMVNALLGVSLLKLISIWMIKRVLHTT
jgi:hypothetical protein